MTLSPFSVNPLNWKGLDLSSKNKNLDSNMKVFQGQLADFCNQVQTMLTNPKLLASVINSNALLQGSSLSVVSITATVTSNQTVNANNAALVYLDYTWTAAADPTITINNLGNAVVLADLGNFSGSGRTYTLKANTPSSTAYAIVQFQPGGVNNLSSGVTVNNGSYSSIIGVSSVAIPQLTGVGSLN